MTRKKVDSKLKGSAAESKVVFAKFKTRVEYAMAEYLQEILHIIQTHESVILEEARRRCREILSLPKKKRIDIGAIAFESCDILGNDDLIFGLPILEKFDRLVKPVHQRIIRALRKEFGEHAL